VKTVLITGVPGTGKTFLAKQLSLSLDYTYFDVGKELEKNNITSHFDKKKACFVVDEAKLVQFLQKVRVKAIEEGDKGLILDSHLSHYLPVTQANVCLVTTCSDLKALEKRLKERGYSPIKIRENLDAEIFDICLLEAKENAHHIVVYDTAITDEQLYNQLLTHLKRTYSL